MSRNSIRAAALLCILLVPITVSAQISRVITLADSLVGGVGGLSIDLMSNIYSADFMGTVWRIKPDGRVSKFATGFYGASGNTFDSRGNLYQASFNGNYVSKVDRNGGHEIWVDEGLSGPVGMVFNADGDLFINNCRGNTISIIGQDGIAKEFASGDLFNCPNGITFGPDGALYVVNFSDAQMIRIDSEGNATAFATIPGRGNGHVTLARGNFYVTAFQTNQVYMVTPDGVVSHVAGTGQFGESDGDALTATFVFPNGIAVDPGRGDRLFVNDYINRTPPSVDVPPVPLANIRMLMLESLTDILASALRSGGVSAMESAYRAHKSDPATAGGFTELAVNAFGYSIMNQGLLDAAIKIFELNAETYPASSNVYDSLAESYMKNGRNDDAIANYEKSLELNGANQNARDMIARIRSDGD